MPEDDDRGMALHQDAVSADHLHGPLARASQTWTFDHLHPFAFKFPVSIEIGGRATEVEHDVIVLFSNHCFTRALKSSEDPPDDLPLVKDGKLDRVLDLLRYEMSLKYLPRLIRDLPQRQIKIADESRPSFVTMEIEAAGAAVGTLPQHYAIFFEVKKDKKRARRLLLRVQSAYVLDNPAKRLLDAQKMRFHVLLKRACAA